MLRSALVAALLLAALSANPARLNAQEPGDVYWQFVPNGVMTDSASSTRSCS